MPKINLKTLYGVNAVVTISNRVKKELERMRRAEDAARKKDEYYGLFPMCPRIMEETISDTDDTPEDLFIQKESLLRIKHNQDTLQTALCLMSDTYSRRINARYRENRSIGEIARNENINKNAVQASLDAAIKKMRKRYNFMENL
jgi:DNA-directed RNA polymerase specialized sigma24 family protein